MQILKTGDLDIIHISTHGAYMKNNPLSSFIEVEGKRKIKTEFIAGKAKSFGRVNPLTIMNMCESGRPDFSLTGIQSWATRFIDAGACAFIGTLWSVGDEFAIRFTKEFYTQLSQGIILGESVHKARNLRKENGDSSWLAYELYGQPNMKIKLGNN
jgi:CHAT domain-containing protein